MIRNALREVRDVLGRHSGDPRANPRWYEWATNQAGHSLIGACLSTLVPEVLPAWLIVGGFYGLVKERGDLSRGAWVRDCILDAGFVTVGALYSGPAHWPWLILGGLAAGVFLQIAVRKGDHHA